MSETAEYSNDGTILTKVIGLTSLTIPNKVKIIQGINANDYAFFSVANTFTTLTFGDDPQLEEIQKYAFYSCKELTSCDLSKCSKLTKIGDYSFQQCSNIKTLNLPSSITKIGAYSFDKIGIKTLFLPPSLCSYGFRCFRGCSNLESIEFAPGINIQSLNGNVFELCSSLNNFTVPSSVTYFAASAFAGCSKVINGFVDQGNANYYSLDGVVFSKDNLTIVYYPSGRTENYTIPFNITKINSTCFYCTKAKCVVLPDSLETIDGYGFGHSSISIINIPKSLKELGDCCFINTKIERIELPEGFQKINNQCFFDCSKLLEVVLPSSINYIGGGAFSNCPENCSVKFSDESNYSLTKENIIITKDHSEIVQFIGSSKTIAVDDSCQIIRNNAFLNHSELTAVTFTQNSELTKIESYAFKGCVNLVDFNFPLTLVSIGSQAFCDTALTSITFGSSLTTISDRCFQFCGSLASVEFESVNDLKIYEYAFDSCPHLNNVSFIGSRITSLGSNCFSKCIKLQTIQFPSSLRSFGQRVFEESGLTKLTLDPDTNMLALDNYSLGGCKSLQTVEINCNINRLGRYCFSESSISQLVLPDSVAVVDEYCFSNCEMLQSFTFSSNSKLQTIHASSFDGCSLLTTIDGNNSFLKTEKGILYDINSSRLIFIPQNHNIRHIIIPETVKIIEQKAMKGNKYLVNVMLLDNSVEEIRASAFEGCTMLRIINFPNSIRKVESYAFRNCKRLQCGLFFDINNQTVIKQLKQSSLPIRCFYTCNAICSNHKKLRPTSTLPTTLPFLLIIYS